MTTPVKIHLTAFPPDLHDELNAAGVVDGKNVALDPANPAHVQFHARLMEHRKAKRPARRHHSNGERREAKETPKESWAIQGAAKWATLHENLNPTQEFIDTFADDFPPTCGCKPHWEQMLKRTPPPIGEKFTLFDWRMWTHARHNEVNVRLNGKPNARQRPVLSWAEACARWGWSEVGA